MKKDNLYKIKIGGNRIPNRTIPLKRFLRKLTSEELTSEELTLEELKNFKKIVEKSVKDSEFLDIIEKIIDKYLTNNVELNPKLINVQDIDIIIESIENLIKTIERDRNKKKSDKSDQSVLSDEDTEMKYSVADTEMKYSVADTEEFPTNDTKEEQEKQEEEQEEEEKEEQEEEEKEVEDMNRQRQEYARKEEENEERLIDASSGLRGLISDTIYYENQCKDIESMNNMNNWLKFFEFKVEEIQEYLGYQDFYSKPSLNIPSNKYSVMLRKYLSEKRYLFTPNLKTFITTFCINGNSEKTNKEFERLFVTTQGGSKNKSKRSMRKSRKSRKQVRKSRKSRKQVRKSRKVVRKSRKSRKQVRRNRK